VSGGTSSDLPCKGKEKDSKKTPPILAAKTLEPGDLGKGSNQEKLHQKGKRKNKPKGIGKRAIVTGERNSKTNAGQLVPCACTGGHIRGGRQGGGKAVWDLQKSLTMANVGTRLKKGHPSTIDIRWNRGEWGGCLGRGKKQGGSLPHVKILKKSLRGAEKAEQ